MEEMEALAEVVAAEEVVVVEEVVAVEAEAEAAVAVGVRSIGS